ncbi:uncharacterized protein LOC62_04G006360 [Vanrija pseudolonga]|uniref:Uncharacterized protein n=1 Tax=Vanrija pseudolonga TaxID=143232 RepID=A0AAF0YBC3_9TREE|nr:hypothetical protein LOC62_04G006360 [Vanrija pseudolonga]
MGRPEMNNMDKIEANIGEDQRLSDSIRELDYAPLDLATARSADAKAKSQLMAKKGELAKLDAVVKDKYKTWQSSQSSTSTRIFTKIRHPNTHDQVLAKRIQHEQNEYEMVFNEQQEVQGDIKVLEDRLGKLSDEIGTLTQVTARHTELRSQRLALHAHVFDGPTPQYPEEDAQENVVNATQHHQGEVEALLAHEREVLGMLNRALECSERAERQFRKARRAARDSENHSRIARHSHKAEENHAEARILLDRAASQQPRLPRFYGDLPSGGYRSARGYSDKMYFCQKLVQHNVMMINVSVADAAVYEADIAATKQRLADATVLLESIRCRIMDERAGARGLGPAPPLYESGEGLRA